MSEIPEENVRLISPNDILVWRTYLKHRYKFIVLLEAGVFDTDSGHFDININNSQIQTVFFNRLTYKREAKNDRIST